MSKRAQIRKRIGTLNEISGIMDAMKNISLIESHKLARFLVHQHRAFAGVEAAARDFLEFNPEFRDRLKAATGSVIVAVGSQRGFCGDFNESLAAAVRRYWHESPNKPVAVLVLGQRLGGKLEKEPYVTNISDGPNVTEEVPTVIDQLMKTLNAIQQRTEQEGLLNVEVLAHQEGTVVPLSSRSILPDAASMTTSSSYCHAPLLHLAPAVFFADLIRHYLWMRMHDIFYASLMAENRRRLQHMEAALQRMKERTDILQRKYNALRQEEITQEIELIILSNKAIRVARATSANQK